MFKFHVEFNTLSGDTTEVTKHVKNENWWPGTWQLLKRDLYYATAHHEAFNKRKYYLLTHCTYSLIQLISK